MTDAHGDFQRPVFALTLPEVGSLVDALAAFEPWEYPESERNRLDALCSRLRAFWNSQPREEQALALEEIDADPDDSEADAWWTEDEELTT